MLWLTHLGHEALPNCWFLAASKAFFVDLCSVVESVRIDVFSRFLSVDRVVRDRCRSAMISNLNVLSRAADVIQTSHRS